MSTVLPHGPHKGARREGSPASPPSAPPAQPSSGGSRPAAVLAAAAPRDLSRARWVEARLRELPRFAIFLYNLLLDRNLPDWLKEQAFGALWYALEGTDLIPPDDGDLAGIDALAIALRCAGEIVAHAPPAALAVYEEVLWRDGVRIRERLAETPDRLGTFFAAVGAVYRDRIARAAVHYKRAIETGYLVRELMDFVASYRPEAWTAGRLAYVEAFLDSFGECGGADGRRRAA